MTDANGEFAVTLLPAGAYRIEAAAAGYWTSTREVALLVNQKINIDLPLLPEKFIEQVNVSASAGLLKAESAALSTVIQNRAIVNLPLDGRNFYELPLLVPGVATAAQGSGFWADYGSRFSATSFFSCFLGSSNKSLRSIFGSNATMKNPMAISSQLWSPQRTSDFGSGLKGLLAELSNHSVASTRVPLGRILGEAGW
jgi:hypothetical protein